MALSDATRRSILRRLSRGPATVGELARPCRMTWPSVTKHLKVLESAHLVRRERDGRMHVVTLNAAALRQAQCWIDQYRRFWQHQFKALEEYLDQTATTGREEAKHVDKA